MDNKEIKIEFSFIKENLMEVVQPKITGTGVVYKKDGSISVPDNMENKEKWQ